MSCKEVLYYTIAGLELCVDKDLMYADVNSEQRCRLTSFKPFQRDGATKSAPDFSASLEIKDSEALSTTKTKCDSLTHLHTFEFSDIKATCHFYRYTTNDGNNYLLTIESQDAIIVEFDYNTQADKATCCAFNNTDVDDYTFSAAIRFGLWFTLGIAAAKHHVAAVHSSTIVHNSQAVMFLGESGTGKSTHTRLWRENIEGATLLNDDSPFIGIVDGKVMVYGSPWSGKTPCYKDESYPLRAIVRLSQAPHNKIRRTKGIAAIGALLPSLPPAFAYDPALKDCMFEILNKVLSTTELYHLECLPNAEAAEVAHKTLFEL
ncbi:MAG: hypothetical protein IKU88_05435 [Alistipes sp.]|nr:hypothetical protein [Alistipes sp.]